MAQLDRRIASAKLWTIYPEHRNSDEICVDGEQLVFERRDFAGYRISEASAQCTAPARLLAVAEAFFDAAGDRDLAGLLR